MSDRESENITTAGAEPIPRLLSVREVIRFNDDDLVDLPIVARELRCSYEHARNLCLNGRLAFVDIGTGRQRTKYRIRWATLQAFKKNERVRANDREFAAVRESVAVSGEIEQRW